MDLVSLFLSVFLVALLYDQFTRKIPTRLRPDQAPKSAFGVVPADGFASQLRASGTEHVPFAACIETFTDMGPPIASCLCMALVLIPIRHGG